MGLDNPLHIAFIVVIVLLVFGARRLPELGRSLGTGMREFKQAITGESHGSTSPHSHDERATLPPATPQGAPPPAQTPPPEQSQAQDASAQRDPAAGERR
jgi:sec-independent protein translocase protein TatA